MRKNAKTKRQYDRDATRPRFWIRLYSSYDIDVGPFDSRRKAGNFIYNRNLTEDQRTQRWYILRRLRGKPLKGRIVERSWTDHICIEECKDHDNDLMSNMDGHYCDE